MPQDMTLGDFVKQLTVRMEQANLVMLFKDETPWHMLFYRLKKTTSTVKPAFITTLRFDWDGPYPRCQELSEFIQALHWTGSVVAANPSYERITLQKDIHQMWSDDSAKLAPEMSSFLDQGLEYAKQEFPQQ